MSIEELGSLGEFIASIAVVASLLFLAVQVRTNNQMTKAATREELFKNDNNYLLAFLDPLTITSAHSKIRNGEPLSQIETVQIRVHEQLNFRGFESYYVQYKLGFLDEATWKRKAKLIRVLFQNNSHIGEMWGTMGWSFDEDFEKEVQRIRAEVQHDDGT